MDTELARPAPEAVSVDMRRLGTVLYHIARESVERDRAEREREEREIDGGTTDA